MTPPPFFSYLEFLLVRNFERSSYARDFESRATAQTFAESHSFDVSAVRRYLSALCHYGLLVEDQGRYRVNANYKRNSDHDALFERYVTFQKPISESGGKWVYGEDGDSLDTFNAFVAPFGENVYWLMKYHLLVINQFFQDHVILECLKSGKMQTQLALGISHAQIFENYVSAPALLETYAEGFATNTASNNLELAKTLNFLGPVDYLDIGGGNGSQALAIKSLNPQLKSVSVLDLPESKSALASSRARWMKRFGTEVTYLYDNFFEANFATKFSDSLRFDVIALSWILHDWNDQQNVAILKRAQSILREDGQILVIEKLKTQSNLANVQDFLMMIMADGFERSLGDYRAIYDAAGLKLLTTFENLKGRDLMVLGRA